MVRVVFITVSFKNFDDIQNFVKSVKLNFKSFEIIVIDNYSTVDFRSKILDFCKNNNFHFIPNENNGYSNALNLGYTYAKKNFIFDYCIFSNPDVIIKSIYLDQLDKFKIAVIGPKILAKNMRNQNPYYIKSPLIIDKIKYLWIKTDFFFFWYLAALLNKFQKFLQYFKNSEKFLKVYALHGSFLIFTKEALKRLKVPFDDNVFLFCEEEILALKCNLKGIDMIYCSDMIIKHLEDGSTDISFPSRKYLRQSFLYYFKKKTSVL